MGNLSSSKFDARTVEPSGSFDLLPKGDYEVLIIDSEMKATKNGDGEYLALELQVTSGEHKGRILWTNLNLRNPNAKAEEIARGTLSAICRAVGVLTPQDSSELHNKPLLAVVRIKTDPTYGDKNEVRGFKPVEKKARTTTKLVTTDAELQAAAAEASTAPDADVPF
jgi:hypothetical protein